MTIDRKYTNFPPGRQLNPMQELFVPYLNGFTANIVCVSPTGSGKTTMFTMLATNFLERGKKVVYIGSMKALVEEKKHEWSDPNHVWNKYEMAIVTGDYKGQERSAKKLINADIIVMTPEAFMSALRGGESKNPFLNNIGAVLIDEFHLVGEGSRGANLEASVIEFTYDFPHVPIVAASATVPNAEQLGAWLEDITKRNTIIHRSTYRPVQLVYHERPVYDEEERLYQVADIVTEHEDQQFLVGVFSKQFGQRLLRELKDRGISADFHYAQLSRDTKKQIEDDFDRGKIRVLVCTSTLFTGVNKPAWGVVITNEKQGGELVPASTLQQLAGRAGRPQFHKEGHVFVVAARRNMNTVMDLLKNGQPVESQLTSTSVIAAHFLAAVYMGRIKNLGHFHRWYTRSLAYLQTKMTEEESRELANEIAEDMRKRGFLKIDENEQITLTRYGTISAQMLVDPYELHDFVMKLGGYFALDNPTDSDLVAVFAQNRKWATPWGLSNYEQQFTRYNDPISGVRPEFHRATIAFWRKLNGQDIPEPFMAPYLAFREDNERILQTLIRVDAEVKKWGKQDHLKVMFARVLNGMDWVSAHRAALKLSKTEMKNLSEAGIQSVDEIKDNLKQAQGILGERRLRELGLKPKVPAIFEEIPDFGSI